MDQRSNMTYNERTCWHAYGRQNQRESNRTFVLGYGATEESGGPQLRKHLYQVGREQNPECRLCGREDETPVHLIRECQALQSPDITSLLRM